MADAFQQFELLLREQLSARVYDLRLEPDDVIETIIGRMDPVPMAGRRRPLSTSDTDPAGYEAIWDVKVQRAGRIGGGKFTGNTLVMMGKDSHLAMGQAADAKYLDPRDTALASYIQCSMVLKRILGGLSVNHQQIAARLIAEPLEDVAADMVEDALVRLRTYKANCFYGDGSASLAQVNKATTTNIVETAGGTEVPIDGGTLNRFMEGDIIVFGTNADPRVQVTGNGANGARGAARVVNVDIDNEGTGGLYLQSMPGVGTIALSDNYHLMLETTYVFGGASNEVNSLAPQGMGVAAGSGLLRSSGVFPGTKTLRWSSGLDVAHHSVLKSFVVVNSPFVDPSMDVITRILDKMRKARKPLPPILIAEHGIWTLFAQLEREASMMTTVPQGTVFNAGAGVSGLVLGHNEHRFVRMESALIAPNTILGINPSTFMTFMLAGGNVIRWKYGNGPLAGIQSIFGPVYADGGVSLSELSDAPFDALCEFGCSDPRANFRISGVKAQRDVT